MRKPAEEIIITNSLEYKKAICHSNSEYNEIERVDYYDRVFPCLLENSINEILKEETFINQSLIKGTFFGFTDPDDAEQMLVSYIFTLAFYLFEPAMKKDNFILSDNKQYDYSKLVGRKDIIGVFAKIGQQTKSSEVRTFHIPRLITFFKDEGPIFKLRRAIPAYLADKMTKVLQRFLQTWAKTLNDSRVMEDVKRYKVVPSMLAAKKILPLPEYIKIVTDKNDDQYIVIHNVKIDGKNTLFNAGFMQSAVSEISCKGIIYDHCYVDCDTKLFYKTNPTGLLFKDCTFNGIIDMNLPGFGKFTKFENCKFNKLFYMKRAAFLGTIAFENCVFYEKGEFKLEFCNFREHNPGGLEIKNCTFYSPFTIKDGKFDGKLDIENTAFFNTYDFTGTEFHSEAVYIVNTIFNRNNIKCEKALAEVLKKHGLNQLAKGLGLRDTGEKESAFDYDAYQVAYNSGFLKPEYAAYFLGKSKVYLAKKRTEDKKKLVRDSIPFKVNGKDIQYPVEALLAFKAKDWEKLKELRKKYPIPTK